MTINWKANDRRKIDPSKKDYVVSQDGFDSMNAVSQKVYLALSRITIDDRKKKANLSENTIARINEALAHMIDAGLISNVEVGIDVSQAGNISIIVRYVNTTLGKSENVTFD